MKYRSVKMMRGVMIADENEKFLTTTEVVNLLNDLQQRLAASEAKITELKEALSAALDWIDAVPDDTVLPAMPGFDRDWVDYLLKEDSGKVE